MSISTFFRRHSPHRDAAERLFDTVVGQSRKPAFYLCAGVPDTFDGRFDLLVLHVFLTLQRLDRIVGAAALGQALIDRMFRVMNLNLRETGVQDEGIGRRIKTMMEGFNGRTAAYRKAQSEADEQVLLATIRRNVFGVAAVDEASLAAMVRYVRAAQQGLADIPDGDVLRGAIVFPEAEFPTGERSS